MYIHACRVEKCEQHWNTSLVSGGATWHCVNVCHISSCQLNHGGCLRFLRDRFQCIARRIIYNEMPWIFVILQLRVLIMECLVLTPCIGQNNACLSDGFFSTLFGSMTFVSPVLHASPIIRRIFLDAGLTLVCDSWLCWFVAMQVN